MEIVRLAAIERVGNYGIFFPTITQALDVLLSEKVEEHTVNKIDFHLGDVVKKINKSMASPTIELINGSTIVLGGMDGTRYRGRGLQGAYLSEAAWADPRSLIFGTLLPMLADNDGWLWVQSSPNGKNAFMDLYQEAVMKHGTTHYATFLPIETTCHMKPEKVEEKRKSFINTWGKTGGQARFEQEFSCSFEADMLGQIYDQQLINNAVRDKVAYDNEHPVWCSLDIGYKDNTALLIYQVVDRRWKILKAYENHLQPISHYIDKIEEMTAEYNTRPRIVIPHDSKKVELISGTSVKDEFEMHGYRTEALSPDSLIDGINGVRRELKNMDIDAVECKEFIRALSQYRYQVNDDDTLSSLPVHDQSSHYADAVRYCCNAKHLVMPRDFILDLPRDNRFFRPTRVSG